MQRGKDAECLWFQKIAEQGHYAGRTAPTDTRQGIYAAAPSGVLLASINSTEAYPVASMLRRALAKWNSLPAEQRSMSGAPPADPQKSRRWMAHFYPQDGLVLKVVTRDLPRSGRVHGRRGRAWNFDYAWFAGNEARQFLPAHARVGDQQTIPDGIVRRLARCHLVDNVRGQTRVFADADVQEAQLTSEVVAVDSERVSLRLRGTARIAAEGAWPVRGSRDATNPREQTRGFEGTFYGRAEYDRAARRFIAFELVALGTRWGGTQYNDRQRDLEPAPMGVLLSLAGDSPADHTPPAAFWDYGWHKK